MEATPRDLVEDLASTGGACASRIDPGANCGAIGSTCVGTDFCEAERRLCAAHEALNIAGEHTPFDLYFDDGNPNTSNDWLVPPQTVATQAGLAREAVVQARHVLELTTTILRASAANTCDLSTVGDYTDAGEFDALPVSEAVALAFAESLDVISRAARFESDALRAVADAQFSDQPEINRATFLSMVLPEGSRSAHAHHEVGGDLGLPALRDIADEGFCPSPRLSPGARRAVELFRISTISPREILGTRPIDNLLDGWTVISGIYTGQRDGLIPRLAVLLSAPHLDTTEVSLDEFLEGFGLELSDFVEARQYLANEIRAFGRSLDATLPERQITASTTTSGKFDLFAGVATPPQPVLDSYWTALARYEEDWGTPGSDPGYPDIDMDDVPSEGATSDVDPADLNHSRLVDAAVSEAAKLIADDDLDSDARALLAEAVGSRVEERRARLQICVDRTTTTGLIIRVETNDAETVAIADGHDGLKCAVTGSIDGAPCDLNDHLLADKSPSAAPSSATFPYRAETALSDVYTDTIDDTDSPLYGDGDPRVFPVFLLRHRPGATTGPGGWEELGGMFVPVPPPGMGATGTACRVMTVVSEADELAAAAIAPSTSYCAMANESCAGVPLDQRIPLENELTSDWDPVESSWRHYLDVAMQAAEHADQLGEDLIRAGLDLDVRAEMAIDELEDICGVSLDVASLGDLTNSYGADCSSSACTGAGERCVAGRCVRDPVEYALTLASTDADRARLADCLGADSTTEWATLGSEALCFWWDGVSADTFCAEAESGQCPFSVTDATCPSTSPGGQSPPSGHAMIAAPAVPLNFFINEPEGGPPPTADFDPASLPCEAIANLRLATTSQSERLTLAREVLSNAAFHFTQLQPIARQLTWVPAPGDFSSIRLNGMTWLSTGDPYEIPGARWPCTSTTEAAELCPGSTIYGPTTSGPLFCHVLNSGVCTTATSGDSPYGTSNRTERARMNDMLARGVLAARILTGTDLDGVRFPFYPNVRHERVGLADPSAAGWVDPDGTNNGVIGAPPHGPPLASAPRAHGETSSPLVWSGGAGAIRYDEEGDSADPVDVALFDMNAGVLYIVSDATTETPGGPGGCTDIPVGAEWSSCPYDLSDCVEIFNDVQDCDDNVDGESESDSSRAQWDRDLGMVVRGFDGEAAAGTDDLAVAEVWEQRPEASGAALVGQVHGALLHPTATWRLGRVTPQIQRLTRYFERYDCGAASCANAIPRTQLCYSNLATAGQPSTCPGAVGCNEYYVDCRSQAEDRHGLEFDQLLDGNRAHIAGPGLTPADIVNGLELLCAAARHDIPGGTRCDAPVEINDVGDLFDAQTYLQCKAAELHESASRAIFRNLPTRAVRSNPGRGR